MLEEMEDEVLYQITSPHYTAGLLFNTKTDTCIQAAPILSWMVGKTFRMLAKYCETKGYTLERSASDDLLSLQQ